MSLPSEVLGLRNHLRRLRDKATGKRALEERLDLLLATLQARIEQAAVNLSVQKSQLDVVVDMLGAQGLQLEALTAKLAELEHNARGLTLAERLVRRTPDEPVSVVFFFQSPETWASWESVWSAFEADPRADVTIVRLPFQHDASDDPEKGRRFLADRNLPFVDFSAYDLESAAPDIVFLQNPYDSTRPDSHSAARLASLGLRLAYIPYGLEVGAGDQNLRWQYDLDLQRLAWRVFVRASRHRRMFARYCQAGSAHVVVTGHPKLDRYEGGHLTERRGRLAEALGERRAILWTPHFSVEDGGWSTFRQYGDAILSLFEQRHDLVLIVRPHPLFFPRLRSVDEAAERAFRARVEASQNIVLDEAFDYAEAFACSDALMADAGSFLLEYLPTEKPVLYLHQAQGPGLNEEGSVVEGYYQAHQIEDIESFVDLVARRLDPMKDRRVAQIDEFFLALDGQAGARIAAHAIGAVLSERSRHCGLKEDRVGHASV